MSAMDKVNNILGKLPFVKLAEKIPSGITGKIPVLNTLVPFANHVAVILAAVVLAACFGGGGNSGGSGGASASAQVANGGEPYVIPDSDFRYELSADGKGVTLLEYIGPGGNIIIPTEIEGLPIVEVKGEYDSRSIGFSNVTSAVIPDYYLPMFQDFEAGGKYEALVAGMPFSIGGETLENITFPKGIKRIPMYAFRYTKALKSYTIPDTVTEIHREAFAYSGLTSIVIPEGVTYIGFLAFEDCVDLKSVTLPESLREMDGWVFRGCSNLETVNLPSHKIEFRDGSYGMGEFAGCTKLSLATQQALRNAGYTGTFARNY